MLFLAGLVDSIGGGGGLISLPAYLFAGLPVHMAIATNKLSSACGTTLSTARFIRKGLVNFRLAVPSVIMAAAGSSLGARLSLLVDEAVLKYILLGVLPIAAFFVLNRHLFRDGGQYCPERSGRGFAKGDDQLVLPRLDRLLLRAQLLVPAGLVLVVKRIQLDQVAFEHDAEVRQFVEVRPGEVRADLAGRVF